jgi:hypothetical protein
MGLLSAIPVIGDLVDSLAKGIDEIFTSDEERGQIDIEKKKIELKKLTTELKAQHAQLQINMVQANHPSIFVAGARPAIIWIGAIGLAYEAILRPIASWIATRFLDIQALMGAEAFAHANPEKIASILNLYTLPSINEDMFMPIVLGVLGIGGMRSWEKIQGKARENLSPMSSEYQELAQTMVDRMKAQKEALDHTQTGNPSIDQFKEAAAKPGFKPYLPDPEDIL